MFTYKNIHKLNKCKYLLAILTRVIYNSIVSSQNPDQAETVPSKNKTKETIES